MSHVQRSGTWFMVRAFPLAKKRFGKIMNKPCLAIQTLFKRICSARIGNLMRIGRKLDQPARNLSEIPAEIWTKGLQEIAFFYADHSQVHGKHV